MFFLILLLFALSSCRAQLRIHGGDVAAEGSAPYQVFLINPKNRTCNGAILNERYILTAAHCVEKETLWKEYGVITGTNDRTKPGAVYFIEKPIIHCNFDKPFPLNDIALIRLNDTIVWNNKTKPIKLAYNKAVKAGDSVVITGWGGTEKDESASEKLLRLKQSVVDNDECNKIRTKLDQPTISIGNICAVTEKSKGPCYGDSGAPLIDKDGDLIGIANMVGGKDGGCATGNPDVYASTLYHIDWINIVMSENNDCHKCKGK